MADVRQPDPLQDWPALSAGCSVRCPGLIRRPQRFPGPGFSAAQRTDAGRDSGSGFGDRQPQTTAEEKRALHLSEAVLLRRRLHRDVMLGFFSPLFGVVDLKIQSLNLFPHLSFALLKTLDLGIAGVFGDRKSTRLNSSHLGISYAV